MNSYNLRENPELKRIVVAGFPSYKKHTVYLGTFPENGMNINSYWDGGSRDEYAIVNLETGKRGSLPTSTHPYFDITAQGLANQDNGVIETDHVGNVRLKILPENFAIIRAGTFCGKAATAFVYLNPANFAKLLTK